jgi:uncharacterized membrane protein YgcG
MACVVLIAGSVVAAGGLIYWIGSSIAESYVKRDADIADSRERVRKLAESQATQRSNDAYSRSTLYKGRQHRPSPTVSAVERDMDEVAGDMVQVVDTITDVVSGLHRSDYTKSHVSEVPDSKPEPVHHTSSYNHTPSHHTSSHSHSSHSYSDHSSSSHSSYSDSGSSSSSSDSGGGGGGGD